jgi:hypothetical protein
MLLVETLFRLTDQTVERALFTGPFAVAESCGSARICVIASATNGTELIVAAALGVESMACARSQWR